MLVIYVDYYNYFGGHKPYTKKFENLVEGFAEYKKIKAHDFDYDDAFHHTECYIRNDFTRKIPRQRPHARSYGEWLKKKEHDEYVRKYGEDVTSMLSKEMINFLLSLDNDNEEVII